MNASGEIVSDFPIVGSFAEDAIHKISSSRVVNWYPVLHPDGKKKWALHPTPGTKLQTEFGDPGPVRQLYFFKNIVYAVSNNSMYQMDSAYVVTPLIGFTFTTNSGFVRIVANQTQVVFCDGINAYLWDTVALTLTDLATVIPPGVLPADIAYMDGFFIVADGLTNRFYCSNIDTGLTAWGALNYAQANSTPTFLKGIARLKRRLFIFGEFSTEVWLDAGQANFPFRRDDNLLFEHGLESAASLVEGFEKLFYLSRNSDGVDAVKMVEGAYPVDISTYELNNLIQTLPDTNKAVGTIKKQDGVILYKITIANRTFVYNVTLSSESKRIWHEESAELDNRSIENCHVYFKNLHFIGDYRSSNLYLYSKDFFNNDGLVIRREIITSALSDDAYRRIMISRIQLDMLQGVGIAGTTATDMASLNAFTDQNPVLEFFISTDGGATYYFTGNASVGQIGQRRYRTKWEKLGNNRQYIFKIITFNAVPLYVLGGSIWYKVGPQ